MGLSSNESADSDDDSVNQEELLSKPRYMRVYENFISWKNERGAKSFSEELLLAYFKELAITKRPTSLWSMYSMLKSTIFSQNNIDIKTYTKLRKYLKDKNEGYISGCKGCGVFTSAEVDTFLKEAPDKKFLVHKVVLIFGIEGACYRDDLANIRVDDIEKHSELLLVKLRSARGKKERTFIIRGEQKDIVEKYMALRPADLTTDRFFVRYCNGKCMKQVIGKNRICTMPRQIASYLNLPNPKLYTGYSFRRTAASLMRSSTGRTKLRRRRHKECTLREMDKADPSGNDTAAGDTMLSSLVMDDIKVEQSPNSPIWSDSASSLLSLPELLDPESSPPPRKRDRVQSVQSDGSKKTECANNTGDTKSSSVPTKNITIVFENCTNVSNITINF